VKQIQKSIEALLKERKIPLKSYGDPVFTEGGWVPYTIYVFIPQLLNGYPIWNAEKNEQIGIQGTYTVRNNQLSLENIDIAKYVYAPYPTRSKDEILTDFTLGMTKLDAPEIVYLEKVTNSGTFYVPALRFVVNENKAIYKELVNF